MLKKVISKAGMLAACFGLLLCTARGASADNSKVQVNAVSSSQTVTVSLNETSWYGKDMSVTCYAPGCPDTTNLANNTQYVVYLDQLKAASSFSFVINSKAVAGSYKLVLGCGGSRLESAFAFDSAPAAVALAAPSNVKAVQSAAAAVKVSWTAVSGATSYDVYRAASAGKNFTKIGSSTKNSYNDKKAKAGKTYYYKVVAVSSANADSQMSTAAKVTLLKAPKVTVKASKKQIKVSWKKISSAKGYKVYVSTKKNSGYKLKATVKGKARTTKVIKKLKSKKTYYVKVAAYIGSGKNVVVGSRSAAVKAKVK